MRKDTIRAENGYVVKHVRHKYTGEKWLLLCDGEKEVMIAEPMTPEGFEDNMEGNECFHIVEIFTTTRGNKFYYCRDEEINVDYLVKIGAAK